MSCGNSSYDGTTVTLRQALDEDADGAIVLCIPGRLAYYRAELDGHGGEDHWIVERRA